MLLYLGLIDEVALEQRASKHDKINHRKHQYIDPEVGVCLAYLRKIKGERGDGSKGERGEQGQTELGGKLSRASQALLDGEHSRVL